MVRSTGKYLIPLFLLWFPILPGTSLQTRNYCNVFGTIYIETQNPKNADFRVFVEDTEGMADVWVYETDDRLFADRPGLWYVTNNKAFADYIIYIESDKYLADFSIYFIDVESFAGCNE